MDDITLTVAYGFICLLIGLVCGMGTFAVLHSCKPEQRTEPEKIISETL